MSRLILAVEDDFAIANLYTAIFSDDRVVVVDNAVDALRVLADEEPDLIILDIALRASHGLSVVNGLGRVAPPVLVVSAQPDADTFARAIGARLIRKPFDVDQLTSTVERMAGRGSAA